MDVAYIDVHTENFGALKSMLRECTPGVGGANCGISEAQIVAFAQLWRDSAATLSPLLPGAQPVFSGTDKNAALINLHLATGRSARPGAGPFSLTGQPNAMGGREVGGSPTCCRAIAT